jgi:plastocyanin
MNHVKPLISAVALMLATTAFADGDAIVLTLKDHRFEPQTIQIPAGKKVKLQIRNLDNTAEEFDSNDLHREKVIPAGQEGVVFIGPLDAGKYQFMGEYHPDTARGVIIVK